ncbi:Trigger factor [Gemmata obscuriglobus]|uniref:Trigger factor n=1 Tax=Gemmata obscuriglobus TaxID=114 RepID=A0A2Z3HEG2_9BACT|nr:trigger factor [Gemmata obscuriglobus]AWM41977.1 trigger factor [Gemmata obscuriglobus]QEG32041.1 Trigger factor [Gemmata obscuriglobus]VTS11391.1 trigger factor : Trigger factor OS=Planctomyces brasiliensis (strain ATCC 49424 / DSM 5305 / JCM 21570 / NBRC 103401 / IFAM 1448) GN=tig PE=3 SV=1: Trigger_N: Trigger_C [Gemmata obscuriglobus UQM 2246]
MANDDETTPPAEATAVAEAPGAEAGEENGKLVQTVEIKDIGPCKKHVKVTVDRKAIDDRFNEKFTELTLSEEPQVRGFRPGKAPRKMIEKRYYTTVADEIKSQVLMASLEQLADEQAISPLSPPEFDPNLVNIPKEGPFVYEFDIEVRPEFDLPEYKGLKLRRPTHTYTAEEVANEKKRLLDPYGQIVPKDSGVAELYDVISADVAISFQGKEINKLDEVQVKVEPQLALSDGVAADFGKTMAGAKSGDVRVVDITLSQETATEQLRGQTVQAQFTVKDVKTTRQPELTSDLLESAFGVSTPEAFTELVEAVLNRRLEYTQRRVAREQVLQQIAAAAAWELPQDMLRKQARKTLARKVMEMRNAGMSDEQIRGRSRILEQDVLKSTAEALKEHFVLQKIAEVEKIEIEEDDIDTEIDRIADQSGESPRKVRARLEKEDLMEAVAADLLERKALDLILGSATYEDYELNSEAQQGEVATVEQAVLPDAPAPAPAEGEAKGDSAS